MNDTTHSAVTDALTRCEAAHDDILRLLDKQREAIDLAVESLAEAWRLAETLVETKETR